MERSALLGGTGRSGITTRGDEQLLISVERGLDRQVIAASNLLLPGHPRRVPIEEASAIPRPVVGRHPCEGGAATHGDSGGAGIVVLRRGAGAAGEGEGEGGQGQNEKLTHCAYPLFGESLPIGRRFEDLPGV